MALGIIDSSEWSLVIASQPSNICAATLLFFSLPSRDHSIGISTSSSVDSFQRRFSLVKHWFFFTIYFDTIAIESMNLSLLWDAISALSFTSLINR